MLTSASCVFIIKSKAILLFYISITQSKQDELQSFSATNLRLKNPLFLQIGPSSDITCMLVYSLLVLSEV